MNRPWMPLYVADYLADTAHLNAAESGAYLHLIMHYWLNDGLPEDDKQLARIAKMTALQWRAAKVILADFFHEGWKHNRIEAEIARAEAKHTRRQEAGKRGGIASANAKQNSSNAASNAASNAQASSSQSERKKDAADAAPVSNEEADLFRRGKAVLGASSGGLIKQLLAAKEKNIALARAAIEQASTKQNPREYVAAIVNGHHDPPERYVDPRL